MRLALLAFVALSALVFGVSVGVYLGAREWRDEHYKTRYEGGQR